MEQKIQEYYKDPKKGLSIQNTFRQLNKDGHVVTKKQVEDVIKNLDKYKQARPHHEQKKSFLKTVSSMTEYQADLF